MAEPLSDLLAEGLGINDDPSVSYIDFMDEYVRFASLPPNQRSSPPKELFNASIRVQAVETLVSLDFEVGGGRDADKREQRRKIGRAHIFPSLPLFPFSV